MLRTVRRGAVPLLCRPTAALLAAPSANADPASPASATTAASSQAELWAAQLQFDDNGTPWTESFFASIKAAGVDEAELNMPWGSREPAGGPVHRRLAAIGKDATQVLQEFEGTAPPCTTIANW